MSDWQPRYGCGCPLGVRLLRELAVPGWRFQHGDRPEAVRSFSDREMADPDIYSKYWPQPVLDWLSEVHAYESSLDIEERVL